MINRLKVIRVPLVFIGLTLLLLLASSTWPAVATSAALRSASALSPMSVADVPSVLVRVLTFSLVPANGQNWFEISWGILIISLLLAHRLNHQQYALSLVVGGLIGGATFVLSGPDAVLLGPAMAAQGLVGFACVTVWRQWRTFHWVGRILSLVVIYIAVWTIVSAFTQPRGTYVAETVAILGAGVVAWYSRPDHSTVIEEDDASQVATA